MDRGGTDTIGGETRHKICDNLKENDFWTGEIYSRRKNGEIYPELITISVVRSHKAQLSHYIAVLTDISGIKDTERRLEELTWQDPITGLSNRALFLNQLGAVIKYCHRGNVTSAVLVLDINGFRAINDSYGYRTGDLVIREFADRLVSAVGKDDTVARISGDEFAVLMAPGQWSPDEAYSEAQALARKMDVVMDQPFEVDGMGTLPIDITTGVYLFPAEGSYSGEVILQHAETAHHSAKVAGLSLAFFEDSMSEEIKRRMQLESELHLAIENEELVLFAQGQFSQQRLAGFEILVRWQHPERGLVEPGKFISMAEKSRLIVKIDRYVLKKALEQLSSLQQIVPSIGCSVNISARHFAEHDFVDSILEIIRASGVDPRLLTLELTESAVVFDVEAIACKMQQLSNMGCKFSLDDLGAGYSSFSHLRKLPISEIKIDRSFVLAGPTDATAASIVEMINRVGETMGARIVAEGVETREHVDFFNDSYPRVDMQGFFFSRPAPLTDLIGELIAASK